MTIPYTMMAFHYMVSRLGGVDLSDDRGVEDSPAKLIWIAAAIVIAAAATAFAINLFGRAEKQVPDPEVPQGALPAEVVTIA